MGGVSHQRGELSCLQDIATITPIDIAANDDTRNCHLKYVPTNLVEARAQKPWDLLDESV